MARNAKRQELHLAHNAQAQAESVQAGANAFKMHTRSTERQ